MATTANQVNAQAANKVNKIFDRNDVKGSIANLAKIGSGCFNSIVNSIHDLSKMNDKEVQNAVKETFQNARNEIQEEINTLNKIPSFKDSYETKTLEEGLTTLLKVEKEILADKDINIVRKSLLIFWTGVKAISALILKSCIKAGKFIALYGIRILVIGLDFIIKIVKKATGFLKSTWRAVKAIKVSSSSGKEEEVNPDEENEEKK